MPMNDEQDLGSSPTEPLDPSYVDLILALGETEAKLRNHLPFDEYLLTLLEKADLEKQVRAYGEENRYGPSRDRYRSAS